MIHSNAIYDKNLLYTCACVRIYFRENIYIKNTYTRNILIYINNQDRYNLQSLAKFVHNWIFIESDFFSE